LLATGDVAGPRTTPGEEVTFGPQTSTSTILNTGFAPEGSAGVVASSATVASPSRPSEPGTILTDKLRESPLYSSPKLSDEGDVEAGTLGPPMVPPRGVGLGVGVGIPGPPIIFPPGVGLGVGVATAGPPIMFPPGVGLGVGVATAGPPMTPMDPPLPPKTGFGVTVGLGWALCGGAGVGVAIVI